LALQHWRYSLGNVIDAPEVRLELVTEGLFWRSFDRADIGVSGIVDQHINAPEATYKIGKLFGVTRLSQCVRLCR
jgi:hypothetical protein